MPETTLFEKLIKQRYMHEYSQEDLAEKLDICKDTIVKWELRNVMPSPYNICRLSSLYNLPLKYFHNYYDVYYKNPGEKIRKWKVKNGYSYSKAATMLGISYSCFGRLLNSKIHISYVIYLKLIKLKVF